MTRARRYGAVLWLLTVLFFLRVIGQVLVAFFDVSFLPEMAAWYSGLLPYAILLPIQGIILLLQVKIGVDFTRGRGLFVRPRPAAGRALQWVSYLYATAMLVRYLVTRTHAIPIVFHWVLAAFLFTLGRFHARAGPPDERPPPSAGGPAGYFSPR
jgi:hypothetical protein